MSVSSQAIANVFLDLAEKEEKPLTNMQLQKLVYIAHGFTLAIMEVPLYYHNTHAWNWGPVIPRLYKSLQKYGRSFVTEKLDAPDRLPEDSREMKIARAVWDGYGHMSGGQLSSLTHKANSPWSITWNENKFGVIPNELIAEYYLEVIEAP